MSSKKQNHLKIAPTLIIVQTDVHDQETTVWTKDGFDHVVEPQALKQARAHAKKLKSELHLHAIRDFEIQNGAARGFRLGDSVVVLLNPNATLDDGWFGSVVAENDQRVTVNVKNTLNHHVRTIEFRRLDGTGWLDKNLRIQPVTAEFVSFWQRMQLIDAIRYRLQNPEVLDIKTLEKAAKVLGVGSENLSIIKDQDAKR